METSSILAKRSTSELHQRVHRRQRQLQALVTCEGEFFFFLLSHFDSNHFSFIIFLKKFDSKLSLTLFDQWSLEKPTAKQETAVNALVTANQNLIDLIARRYSSPSDTLKNAMANSNVIANARKNLAVEIAGPAPDKPAESQQTSQTPTTPTTPNKFSPGNIFKNFFK